MASLPAPTVGHLVDANTASKARGHPHVTTHSTSDPRSPQHRPPAASLRRPATAPAPDSTAVPITVWRLDSRATANPVDGFATRLARRLIQIYTEPHDTVADFDDDPHLEAASHAAGRTYLSLTGPASLQTLGRQPGAASLIVCRWPRLVAWPTRPTTLFAACHLVRAPDGCVVAALRRRDTDRVDYVDHTRILQQATQASGFRHVLQIVAVGGADTGDQFTYYATAEEATEVVGAQPGDAGICYIDMLAHSAASPGHPLPEPVWP
ncbi:hypothetical protein GCM10023170_084410 [Phytohabitans houttuyneae]